MLVMNLLSFAASRAVGTSAVHRRYIVFRFSSCCSCPVLVLPGTSLLLLFVVHEDLLNGLKMIYRGWIIHSVVVGILSAYSCRSLKMVLVAVTYTRARPCRRTWAARMSGTDALQDDHFYPSFCTCVVHVSTYTLLIVAEGDVHDSCSIQSHGIFA